MFDAMRIGGVSGWVRVAEVARLAGLPVSTHVFPEISAHLLSATPTAYRLEYVDKVGPILHEPVKVSDGHVLIADSPGSGIEWDEGAIAALSD
jgi:mandelate racemase